MAISGDGSYTVPADGNTTFSVSSGAIVTLTAQESECCKFLYWTSISSTNPYEFNVNTYQYITGNFIASPTVGMAIVDGNNTEWDLSTSGPDFYAYMYRAGNLNKPVESNLYLRYDCSAGVLYALVIAQPGVNILANFDSDSFIKIDGTKKVDGTYGDDGTPPDFAWIGLSGNYASGWEASITLAVGSYSLNVHSQVDDGGQQTSAVKDRDIPLTICCPPTPTPTPTPIPTPERIKRYLLGLDLNPTDLDLNADSKVDISDLVWYLLGNPPAK